MNNPQSPTSDELVRLFPEIAFAMENELLRNEIRQAPFRSQIFAGQKRAKIKVPLSDGFSLLITPSDMQSDMFPTWFIKAIRHTKQYLEKKQVSIIRANVSIEYPRHVGVQVLFSGTHMAPELETFVFDVLKKCQEITGEPLLPLDRNGKTIPLPQNFKAKNEDSPKGNQSNE
jgi:hypothetical protein